MDCIQINGIRAYGYTGALPEEQVLGQWFEVDLTLWLDLSAAIASDRLADTHDYRADVKAIQNLLKTRKFNLIEAAAGAIADTVLSSSNVEQVQVRLTKVAAPIPEFDGKIAVEITRATPREG
ncbi:dihydroneopterin aldolase [Oculatella sp. LEGE 06141]|uniref:dihydroneopterin aldolase n=1 Tax=Oculatella sp. LEGE 06141 TaxID=1828648 RepID=UPI00188132D5|nr:dihydroneopterin aldolase [Oculatella sp. LEGE 06141]MBE9181311.1 dihydroneopterin aldolase [Oculatella sp. LEGE 06141]